MIIIINEILQVKENESKNFTEIYLIYTEFLIESHDIKREKFCYEKSNI